MADERYTALFKQKTKDACRLTLKYILERNIICGDALDLRTTEKTPQPIVFSEWSMPFHDSRILRRDFVFSELLPEESKKKRQPDFFTKPEHVSDYGEKVFLPAETRSYSPVHFLKVAEAYD
jgi:hypothetical protein